MSALTPQFEFVDRAGESIRYLEHGWPTDLCRWHSHPEYELHLILETQGKVFVGDYIGEFVPGTLFLIGPNLPHNWITDEFGAYESVVTRDMLIQFSHDSIISLQKASVNNGVYYGHFFLKCLFITKGIKYTLCLFCSLWTNRY